jgi:hypothetical protein
VERRQLSRKPLGKLWEDHDLIVQGSFPFLFLSVRAHEFLVERITEMRTHEFLVERIKEMRTHEFLVERITEVITLIVDDLGRDSKSC